MRNILIALDETWGVVFKFTPVFCFFCLCPFQQFLIYVLCYDLFHSMKSFLTCSIVLVIHVWRFICSIYYTYFGNKIDKIRHLLLLMLAFSFGDALTFGMAHMIIPTCDGSIHQIWSWHRCISLGTCSSTSSKNGFGTHHCWGTFLCGAFWVFMSQILLLSVSS